MNFKSLKMNARHLCYEIFIQKLRLFVQHIRSVSHFEMKNINIPLTLERIFFVYTFESLRI